MFACAKSLWDECQRWAKADSELNLSDAYAGMDGLMREVMRIGGLFERWASRHVDFPQLTDVWPYLLDERFGTVCVGVLNAGALAAFDDDDCLRVALRLLLPIRRDGILPLPVDIRVQNPNIDMGFKSFCIQTARNCIDHSDEGSPFVMGDDPFDENFDGIYLASTESPGMAN